MFDAASSLTEVREISVGKHVQCDSKGLGNEEIVVDTFGSNSFAALESTG